MVVHKLCTTQHGSKMISVVQFIGPIAAIFYPLTYPMLP